MNIPLIIWGDNNKLDQVRNVILKHHLDEVEMTRKYRNTMI